jgi:hypothetical protein
MSYYGYNSNQTSTWVLEETNIQTLPGGFAELQVQCNLAVSYIRSLYIQFIHHISSILHMIVFTTYFIRMSYNKQCATQAVQFQQRAYGWGWF